MHPLRLYTELYDFSPYKLGSLRIRENKILAIVVDVEQDPPCKPAWVREALEHILEHAAQVRAPALNLPLLGHRYGKLEVDACLELTVEALLKHQYRLQSRISLCMDRQHMARAYRKLAASGLMENRVYPLFRS